MAVKMYVSYHKWNTENVGGTTMQSEGPFISSEVVDITAGGTTKETPADCDYAEVWADGPFYYAAEGSSGVAAKDSSCKPWPANTPVQIPNVTPFGSEIKGIAI